jgi:DNA adenine methylase
MESPFGWPGGKRNLKKLLLELMPTHKAYVEVFSGSAKLLFAKKPSAWEIVNDINDDLVNFFRVAKHRPCALAERLEHDLVAAGRFRELRADRGDDELERALRFLYLVWYSFGSKGEHFASTTIQQLDKAKSPVRRSLATVRTILADTADRLRNVLVESRDFADCIRRYDSRDTFFYCDPPYTSFQSNGRYKPLGERNRELFKSLSEIKGKFLLSFDDAPEVRKLARQFRFKMKAVRVNYSMSNRSAPVLAGEVLIANYPLAC